MPTLLEEYRAIRERGADYSDYINVQKSLFAKVDAKAFFELKRHGCCGHSEDCEIQTVNVHFQATDESYTYQVANCPILRIECPRRAIERLIAAYSCLNNKGAKNRE